MDEQCPGETVSHTVCGPAQPHGIRTCILTDVMLCGCVVKFEKLCSGTYGVYTENLCFTALTTRVVSRFITHFRTFHKSKLPLKSKGIKAYYMHQQRKKSELVLCFFFNNNNSVIVICSQQCVQSCGIWSHIKTPVPSKAFSFNRTWKKIWAIFVCVKKTEARSKQKLENYHAHKQN